MVSSRFRRDRAYIKAFFLAKARAVCKLQFSESKPETFRSIITPYQKYDQIFSNFLRHVVRGTFIKNFFLKYVITTSHEKPMEIDGRPFGSNNASRSRKSPSKNSTFRKGERADSSLSLGKLSKLEFNRISSSAAARNKTKRSAGRTIENASAIAFLSNSNLS